MKMIKTAASMILLAGLVSACSQESAETQTVETAPAAVETTESKDMMQQAGEQAEAAMASAKEMAAEAEEKAAEVMAAAEDEVAEATEAAKAMAAEAPATGEEAEAKLDEAKDMMNSLNN